jgi:beta-xylosidase
MQAPEGPHVYLKDGWYYLLAAEGTKSENCIITVILMTDN